MVPYFLGEDLYQRVGRDLGVEPLNFWAFCQAQVSVSALDEVVDVGNVCLPRKRNVGRCIE
jgi:hypothetical protein